jgi:hypothetical protein
VQRAGEIAEVGVDGLCLAELIHAHLPAAGQQRHVQVAAAVDVNRRLRARRDGRGRVERERVQNQAVELPKN